MSIEITVPQLPESVEEATIGEWHKKPGDKVSRDENVVDLETDKVMLEVPVTSAGVIKEILKEEGETVTEGDVLAVLSEEGEEAAAEEQGSAEQEEAEGESAGEQAEGEAEAESAGEQAEEEEKATDQEAREEARPASGKREERESRGEGRETALSPAVRKLIAEHNLDPDDIEGSGKNGRILKSDVLEYLDQQEEKKGADEEKRTKEATGEATESRPSSQPQEARQGDMERTPPGARVEQRVPMTRIRARIAERLVEAQRNAAMLTTFNEVDLESVNHVRARYKEQFEKQHEVRLGYMSFFVKASVEALKRYPVVNAYIDGQDIVYHSFFDIGIAVASPRGLVVPILRDADQKSFAEIEQQVVEFGQKTRDNKLTMDDLKGGTFSITNGGVFGSMLSTPILNPPQSAILGMHSIQNRPMVVDGEIKARPVMYLALSYDHRIVDGREAVLFLRTIKETLEDPARLLLQI